MANDNAKRIEETWNKVMGNEPVQFVYGKNPKQITTLIYKGDKISTSAWCGKAIENKIVAMKNTQSCVKQENEVMINDERNTIYLNGVRYTMWDVIKGMSLNRIYDYIAEYKDGEDWQIDLAEKLKAYMTKEGIIEKIFQISEEMGAEDYELTEEDEDDDMSDLVYNADVKRLLGYV